MIHIDKVSTVKRAGSMQRISSRTGLDQAAQGTGTGPGTGIARGNSPRVTSPRPMSSGGVSYPLTRTPLKDATLREQITSNTYIQLTIFFVISSFWANFKGVRVKGYETPPLDIGRGDVTRGELPLAIPVPVPVPVPVP